MESLVSHVDVGGNGINSFSFFHWDLPHTQSKQIDLVAVVLFSFHSFEVSRLMVNPFNLGLSGNAMLAEPLASSVSEVLFVCL